MEPREKPDVRSPESMQAVQLTGHGGLEALTFREDVPVPRPATNDVLISVTACGMNNTDIWTRQAAYGDNEEGWKGELDFPIIQGADIVGTIVDVGDSISIDRVGERVVVDPALYADADSEFEELIGADLLGSERDGGYAEYVIAPARNAHTVSRDITDAELATFPTAYATAERMLNRANVDAEDTILVTGASGGVGTGLIQLAQRRNATVVAVTSSQHRDQIVELGAEHVICRDETSVPRAIETHLERGTVDVVADVVGGAGFQSLLEHLRPGGRLVVAGAVADPVVEVDLRTVYLDQLTVIGSTMWTRSEFEDLIQYIEHGEISPLLADTYPLSALPEAQRRFMTGSYLGKLVVTP